MRTLSILGWCEIAAGFDTCRGRAMGSGHWKWRFTDGLIMLGLVHDSWDTHMADIDVCTL